jgi:hypothetical protein
MEDLKNLEMAFQILKDLVKQSLVLGKPEVSFKKSNMTNSCWGAI